MKGASKKAWTMQYSFGSAGITCLPLAVRWLISFSSSFMWRVWSFRLRDTAHAQQVAKGTSSHQWSIWEWSEYFLQIFIVFIFHWAYLEHTAKERSSSSFCPWSCISTCCQSISSSSSPSRSVAHDNRYIDSNSVYSTSFRMMPPSHVRPTTNTFWSSRTDSRSVRTFLTVVTTFWSWFPHISLGGGFFTSTSAPCKLFRTSAVDGKNRWYPTTLSTRCPLLRL